MRGIRGMIGGLTKYRICPIGKSNTFKPLREGDHKMDTLRFYDTNDCFEKAIKEGRLSRDRKSELYAGNHMYMGTWNGKDTFKNCLTRKYID